MQFPHKLMFLEKWCMVYHSGRDVFSSPLTAMRLMWACRCFTYTQYQWACMSHCMPHRYFPQIGIIYKPEIWEHGAFSYLVHIFKGACSPWKSWASDRKLLTRAPEKRISHQNSQKINIFQNIKQRIYSFWRHFPNLRDAVLEVMVNGRHTRKSNAVRRIWWLGP